MKENWKPSLPDFTVNKARSGYEIRSDVLTLAKDLVMNEYQAKYAAWEFSVKKDPTTGEIVTSVNMPAFPGLDTILETAEKMYSFINSKK